MKFIPIVAFLVVLITQSAWADQIIIWQDDKGVTHIGYGKPNDLKKKGNNLKKYKSDEMKSSKIERTRNDRNVITQMCKDKWGTNYRMIKYCIDMQSTSKKNISGSSGIIKDECEKKWGTNYRMIEYCINMQRTAKQNIERNYSGPKRKFCENKWGNNFRMVKYCLEK